MKQRGVKACVAVALALLMAAAAMAALGPAAISSAAADGQAPPTEAAATRTLRVNAYLDTRLNNEFRQADDTKPSFAYTSAPPEDDTVTITLDAPDVLAAWKGAAVLRDDAIGSALWFSRQQFAPVFLVVEIVNDSNRTQQVVSAWFELIESVTDRQPFLLPYKDMAGGFPPTFRFANLGWSRPVGATLRFAFGTADGPVTRELVTSLGIHENDVAYGAIDSLTELGVDIPALDVSRETCPLSTDGSECAIDPHAFDHLLGELAGATFVTGTSIMTRMTGRIEYDWVDAGGTAHRRSSPVSVDYPIVTFIPPDDREPTPGLTAAGGISRDYPTVFLPLDRRELRVPVSLPADLAPGEARRYAFNFEAERASRHRFRFVFELADGNVASSPKVDLFYFTPRPAGYELRD